jgi:Flp pilus assembly protein TadG
MIFFARMRLLAKVERAFAADRTGGAAMEFAIVGTFYFLLVFFVLQGGVYYLRATVLDYATEVVARSLEINDNSSSVIAPTSSSAFAYDIAQNSFGLLNYSNIAVSLKECQPAGFTGSTQGDGIKCTGGFSSMSLSPIDTTGNTYQYFNGTCAVNYYVVVADNGQQAINVLNSNCAGGTVTTNGSGTPLSSVAGPVCDTTNFNYYQTASNPVVLVGAGYLSTSSATAPATASVTGPQGQTTNPYTYTSGGHTFTYTQYNGGLYTCSAGQDFLVQVTYTDNNFIIPLIPQYISGFFGTITSTLTGQFEPPLS